MNIDQFFSDIVFGWMCKDIERELALAKSNQSAGNMLCALALMAYTEFMASVLPPWRKPEGGDRNHFDAFFRELGNEYKELLDGRKINVYKIFRCGLAHEYFIKRTCTIAMLNSSGEPFEVASEIIDSSSYPPTSKPSVPVQRPVKCGIGVASNGSYYFVVEKYFDDFKTACEKLRVELRTSQGQNALRFIPRITSESG